MNTIQLGSDIPFRVEAKDSDRFVRCFEEAVHLAFKPAEQRTIVLSLQYVRWTNDVDVPDANAYVQCTDLASRRGFASFLAMSAVHMQDKHLKRLVVHEMEHVLQMATGYFLSPALIEGLKYQMFEDLAEAKATKFYGASPHLSSAVRTDIPQPDEFDRLVGDWKKLKPDQRDELHCKAFEFIHQNQEEEFGPKSSERV